MIRKLQIQLLSVFGFNTTAYSPSYLSDFHCWFFLYDKFFMKNPACKHRNYSSVILRVAFTRTFGMYPCMKVSQKKAIAKK
jgi:hypothetical protein